MNRFQKKLAGILSIIASMLGSQTYCMEKDLISRFPAKQVRIQQSPDSTENLIQTEEKEDAISKKSGKKKKNKKRPFTTLKTKKLPLEGLLQHEETSPSKTYTNTKNKKQKTKKKKECSLQPQNKPEFGDHSLLSQKKNADTNLITHKIEQTHQNNQHNPKTCIFCSKNIPNWMLHTIKAEANRLVKNTPFECEDYLRKLCNNETQCIKSLVELLNDQTIASSIALVESAKKTAKKWEILKEKITQLKQQKTDYAALEKELIECISSLPQSSYNGIPSQFIVLSYCKKNLPITVFFRLVTQSATTHCFYCEQLAAHYRKWHKKKILIQNAQNNTPDEKKRHFISYYEEILKSTKMMLEELRVLSRKKKNKTDSIKALWLKLENTFCSIAMKLFLDNKNIASTHIKQFLKNRNRAEKEVLLQKLLVLSHNNTDAIDSIVLFVNDTDLYTIWQDANRVTLNLKRLRINNLFRRTINDPIITASSRLLMHNKKKCHPFYIAELDGKKPKWKKNSYFDDVAMHFVENGAKYLARTLLETFFCDVVVIEEFLPKLKNDSLVLLWNGIVGSFLISEIMKKEAHQVFLRRSFTTLLQHHAPYDKNGNPVQIHKDFILWSTKIINTTPQDFCTALNDPKITNLFATNETLNNQQFTAQLTAAKNRCLFLLQKLGSLNKSLNPADRLELNKARFRLLGLLAQKDGKTKEHEHISFPRADAFESLCQNDENIKRNLLYVLDNRPLTNYLKIAKLKKIFHEQCSNYKMEPWITSFLEGICFKNKSISAQEKKFLKNQSNRSIENILLTFTNGTRGKIEEVIKKIDLRNVRTAWEHFKGRHALD